MKKTVLIGIGIIVAVTIALVVIAYDRNNIDESQNLDELLPNVIPKGKNYSVTLTENVGVKDTGP